MARPITLSRVVALGFVLATNAAATPLALAQTAGEKAAAAQALFDEAMRLMRTDHAVEACPKLEEAQRLDAGMATQFRLAECYEKVGKLASAWASFIAVADSAGVAKLPDREAAARKRADALAARIPRLTIIVPPAVAALDGVDVQRDGVSVGRPLWGVPVPIDPGEHVVTVKAPGKKVGEARLSAGEAAGTLTTTVQPPEDLPQVVATALPPQAPPPHRGRSAVPAIVLGGVAVVGAVTGAALFAVHSGKSSDADALSGQIKGSCVASFDPRCATLASDASSSDTFGNVSTVAFVAGGAAAVGMITYLLWPSAPAPLGAIRLSPALGEGQRGLFASGSF
jgi:hypothetical protein